jgi:hypothetical protein
MVNEQDNLRQTVAAVVDYLRRRADLLPRSGDVSAAGVESVLSAILDWESDQASNIPPVPEQVSDTESLAAPAPVSAIDDFERFKPILLPEDYSDLEFFARITGNAEADTPAQNRWVYAWSEVEKTTAGYGGWTTLSGGRSGTTSTDPARNTVEDMNDGAGVEGNGVDVANLDTDTYTFAIQPIPAGVIVRIYKVLLTTGAVEYWFALPNGVDGTCD